MPPDSVWSRLWSPIFHRGTPGNSPVRLGPNRIYILPTKTGVAFGLFLVVLLLISINYNNAPGYLLTFLLTGLGLVSLLHTHRGLAGLLVSHGSATPVFAGSRAEFPIAVANPSPWPRYAIQIGWSRIDTGPVRDVPADSEIVFQPSLPARTRGELRPAQVAVGTLYPLGLFRAWSWVILPMRCVVYPAPSFGPEFVNQQQAPGESEPKRIALEGEEYQGLRNYRPGDPLRRIAWKAAARGKEMVSKEFAGSDQEAEIVLDWDELGELATEARLSRLCRLALDAEASGSPYSLRIPGQRIGPGQGPRQIHACLTALALFPQAEP